ncbi:MAG: hypothetical protein WBZ20_04760 [Nitrososphaeraceae archaeon]
MSFVDNYTSSAGNATSTFTLPFSSKIGALIAVVALVIITWLFLRKK